MTEPQYGFPIPIPFVESLGIRCTLMEGGRSELVLPIERQHHNGLNMAHGGVLMTLLDVGMAVACRSLPPRSAAPGEDHGVVTIEMKTTFLSPGSGTLRSQGQCIHRTGSMAFAEAQIVDAEDRVVARSSGTFKYVRRRPEAGQPQAGQGNGDG
ncbi:PaaI family thioesterase [Cupriavidus sp. AU9028]|uniref:PaaI family thioesterase n=1 Tax=Cupriavidus sp. AU9028 TaxID=2871157 RepID=UPI001C955CA1|nr:PaaI family thioesterase [Cupriavidus sp. AU9028]MBY4897485.1 PaaI family thioesterase [Cupriavidus sp. AU9028]